MVKADGVEMQRGTAGLKQKVSRGAARSICDGRQALATKSQSDQVTK